MFALVRDIVVTKNQTFTIVPPADLQMELYYPSNYISDYGYYTVSDELALSVNPTKYVYDPNSSSCYHTYQVTAKETGNYIFKVTVSKMVNNLGTPETLTYNITVVDVTNITMQGSLSLFIGESYVMSPVITDSRATTTLTWISSNTSVATVDEGGTIAAVGVGTTIVTCTALNGVSAQCEVTVSPMPVSSITLNRTEAELIVGEKQQLSATVLPVNASDNSVTWSSTNESVAVVNESGLVTATGAGICNITATANDGSGKSASCLVTVLGNVMFCENFGAVPGATITLPIQLTNADAIQGFEFKLVLPEGVSVETNGEGKLMATLTDRASTQGLEGASQGNNTYQFVFTSTNRLLGTSGAVVNIPLVVAEGMAVGLYDVVVKDVELVKYGTSSQIHHGDRTATLTIKEMTLGDVNGDGRVSVADAISIINYVLGRTPVSFITKAADVNGDGEISLADAVATVDIILRSGGNARAAVLSLPLDAQ
jgi:uncharacterized protein YjdB